MDRRSCAFLLSVTLKKGCRVAVMIACMHDGLQRPNVHLEHSQDVAIADSEGCATSYSVLVATRWKCLVFSVERDTHLLFRCCTSHNTGVLMYVITFDTFYLILLLATL